MEEVTDLHQLETQIDYLLGTLEQLRLENLGLRQQLSTSLSDQKKVRTQNLKAAKRIREILSQLKEQCHE